MMMLSGEDAGVQEHEGHDQPEHPLRLADVPTLFSHRPVPSGQNKNNNNILGVNKNHQNANFS